MKAKPAFQNQKLPQLYNSMLIEISKQRKAQGHLIKTKEAIICSLIADLYESEIDTKKELK